MQDIVDDIDRRMQHLVAQDDCAPGSTEHNRRFSFFAYTYEASWLQKEEQLYAVLNQDLRSRSTGRFKLWMPFLYHLTCALCSLPDVADTVFRGMNKLPATWIVDGTASLFFPGFSSTSTKEQVARNFAAQAGVEGVVLKIKVVNAKDLKDVSWFGAGEEELLLSPNMEFVVVNPLYDRNGIRYLDLQQVPKNRIWS
uniref:NAD(P)(+)--arginine ADP-ribosyltransferase n=2 Tax=Eutreptiella gymnastica TaxID=73025 RepID=A0A7S4G5S8_9EUGL